MLVYLQALAKPLAICLVVGATTTLQTYQGTGRWGPALVAGGIDAAKVAGVMLGINGVIFGARGARAQAGAQPPAP